MKRPASNINRIISTIAGAMAGAMAILLPVGYFAISYQYLLGTLDARAELAARQVERIIVANPAMWRFEQIRLEEILEQRSQPGVPEQRRVLDPSGKMVAESRDPMSRPVVSRRYRIHDAGQVVAQMEISQSLAPVLAKTGVVAVVSWILSAGIFYLFRIVPLRAIRQAQQVLEQNERKYRSLYVSMKEGMAIFALTLADDGGGTTGFTLLDMNPSCELILGRRKGDVIGRDGPEVFGPGILPFLHDICGAAARRESLTVEMSLPERKRFLNVSVFPMEGETFGTLVEDITQRRHAAEQIQRLAYYDQLTSLPNRLLLLDRLRQAVARAGRDNAKLSILFLDLDRFKVVNDTLGHAYGDLLLTQVAQRLSGTVRTSDTLARLGGDEFVLLCPSAAQESAAAHAALHLLQILSPPYTIRERTIYTSASIGVAMFPDDGADPESLLRCADLAMYSAKEKGGNAYNFYSEEMNRKAHERMEVETSLRDALVRDEFFLEFQPVVDASSGRVTAVEALVRWMHPEKGRVPPGEFISVAEDSGLILPLGEWVLRTACRKLHEWQAMGLPALRLAVNVSGLQFAEAGFVEKVGAVVAETGVDPHLLELELTETSLMKNAEATVETLFRLKELNLSIAVDDFGTGYSSLTYLKNFPIDRVKIDRSFVMDVCDHPDDRAIVEVIIAMANQLNLEILAEGVEKEEQRDFLLSRGCIEMQGFLFSTPLSEHDLLTLLEGEPRLPVNAPAVEEQRASLSAFPA